MGLPNKGYSDAMVHVKQPGEETDKDGQRAIFPTTRYDNILNRPRAISKVDGQPSAPFHLLICEEIEVSDDLIYKMTGQIW